MYKVTLSLTRPNTSVLWQDPTSDEDLYEVLFEAAKRNITADQTFSSDSLTMSIVWSAPSQEVWDEFSHKFLRKNGEIDDTWYNTNDISYKITKEYIDG